MEVLAGLKIKGVNKTPKIKAHKIDNLTQVLKVMETEKIRLVSISKQLLVCLQTYIARYEGLHARDLLKINPPCTCILYNL